MDEQTAWTTSSSITSTIHSIDWSDTTYMYLERVPMVLLEEQEISSGIRLEHYDATAILEEWQRGRIFDKQQEVKWDWSNGSFHLVYCGKHVPSELTIFSMEAAYARDAFYYTWGRRITDEKVRQELGLPSDAVAFVELQIPRILSYPVAKTTWRVQIHIKEFYASDGNLSYSRWFGLKEIEEVNN